MASESTGLTASGTAPAGSTTALARSINLEHTVQLIKVTIDVVEDHVPRLAEPGQEAVLREAVVRFSREVAFAAARVYARAAETRRVRS